MSFLTLLAEASEYDVQVAQSWGKALVIAFALGMAALGLGLVGMNYMKAVGRNPEAGKVGTNAIIIAAMIELTALLAFVMSFTL